MNTCTTCRHSGASTVYVQACYRPKRFKSGLVLKAPHGVGFATTGFELGPASIYEGRADGDNCGENYRHWSPRTSQGVNLNGKN